MATVYSLVCFGGLLGKTVTFTDAGDVVNLTNHGLRQGVTGIVFSSTGSLPTGITAGTTYYPRDGADANKFTIYPTKADALAGTNQVTFSGTGSGTHTVKSAYMLGLSAAQLARYGDSGSERIYNGIPAWNTAAAARGDDSSTEVCEIGEIFTDITGATYITLGTVFAQCTIWTRVDGVRSAAFHNGIVGGGYILQSSSPSSTLNVTVPYTLLDGFEVRNIGSSGSLFMSSSLSSARSLICAGKGVGNTTANGVVLAAGALTFVNNIVIGYSKGVLLYPYTNWMNISNNLICKNEYGFTLYQTANVNGIYINNIVVNNSIYNYQRQHNTNKATHNVGEIADKRTITVDASTDIFTLTAHTLQTGAKVVFTTSGTLPAPLATGTVYYTRDITTDTFKLASTSGGAAINITGVGTGTHYLSNVYDTKGTAIHIDMADKNSIWVDYDNYDFRLIAGSPLIDAGVEYITDYPHDIVGNIRPNYEAATYPDNYWDVGPFEYDHGDGLAPQQVDIEISGMAEGSVLAVYKTSNGTAIISPTTIGASGNHSIIYSYAGDTQITVVVRKGTSGTKYLPYTAHGLITSSGFSLIVNQVVDGVLNG